jgi:hypothetical protein
VWRSTSKRSLFCLRPVGPRGGPARGPPTNHVLLVVMASRSMATPAPSRARISAGAGGSVRVDAGRQSCWAPGPTRSGRIAVARSSARRGVTRSRLDRYAHWSSTGSSVANSMKTVVPCWLRGADRHRSGGQLRRVHCRRKDPDVRSRARRRYLKRGRHVDGARRLQIGQCVEQCGLSVEVCNDESADVARHQRIEAWVSPVRCEARTSSVGGR